jgi:hypothetical protein
VSCDCSREWEQSIKFPQITAQDQRKIKKAKPSKEVNGKLRRACHQKKYRKSEKCKPSKGE